MTQLHFVLTMDDFFAFHLFYYKNTKITKTITWIVRAVSLICITAVLLNNRDATQLYAEDSIQLIFFGVLFLFTTYLMHWGIYLTLKFTLKPSRKNIFLGDRVLYINEEDITQVTSLGSVTRKYEEFERVELDDSRIYIIRDGLAALIIPFTAFETKSTRQEFLRFMKEKIKK